MSKVKSPQAKKRLSLSRDRRNSFGENDKASRKLIPLGKARTRRAERRGVGQALAAAIDHLEPVEAECKARELGALKSRQAFVKDPDQPLGVVLARKRARRSKPASATSRG